MTYVTCPIRRYHPAVVAQKAATLQLLADGRFTLGLGSGENLNEHVAGQGWPAAATRQDMLAEAIAVIRARHTGELVDHHGEHYRVDSGRAWDLPEQGVEIAVAVGGEDAVARFAPLADHLVATEPDPALVAGWNGVAGAPRIGSGGARGIGQLPMCWDPDRERAVERAHEQFRWFAGGWPVNADLPTTAGFAAASQFVRPEDVAESIPCGPDLDAVVEAVRPFWDAGFTDVAVVHVGDGAHDRFLEDASGPLLEKLRSAVRRSSRRRRSLYTCSLLRCVSWRHAYQHRHRRRAARPRPGDRRYEDQEGHGRARTGRVRAPTGQATSPRAIGHRRLGR